MTNTECIKRFGKTRKEVAEVCDVHPQTVDKWFLNENGLIPAKYCPVLRMATGVSFRKLNPRVFTAEWERYEHDLNK